MSTKQINLPPYLTSGASSRSHHALLAKLHDASSTQEEEAIMLEEVTRIKALLSDQRVKTFQAKITECLVVLLHCFVMGSKEVMGMIRQEWSLIAGLRVAEGGTSLRERRIGYLHLSEVMPPGHELHLMLINTIRKDLTSSNPHDILLALHAIAQNPSEELRPAVEPVLISKALLKHKLPVVRQRVIQSLIALHGLRPSTAPFVISLSQISKLLRKEVDLSVLTALFRALSVVLRMNAQQEQAEIQEEKRQTLIDLIVSKCQGLGQQGRIDVLNCLNHLAEGRGTNERITDYLGSVLRNISSSNGSKATLPDICQLYTSHFASHPNLTGSILQILEQLVSPSKPTIGGSSKQSINITPSNDHVLFLRCLDTLPKDSWEAKFSEDVMGVIMGGLDSFDPTIRKMTIKLLHKLSPALTELSMSQNLEAIRSKTNLALPLKVPSNLDASGKITLGRRETAERVLEISEVVCVEDGEAYGRGVMEVLQVLGEEQVWEDGVRRIMHFVQARSPTFINEFIHEVFKNPNGGVPVCNTAIVIRCTLAAELSQSFSHIETILASLSTTLASVQELILITALAILRRPLDGDLSTAVIRLEDGLQLLQSDPKTSALVIKRCRMISRILFSGRLAEAVSSAKSSSIPDVLESALRVDAELRKHPSRTTSYTAAPRYQAWPAGVGGSGLRYEAYEAPHTGMKRLQSPLRSASRYDGFSGDRTGYGGMSAGEYALLGANKDYENDDDDDKEPSDLVGLSLYDRRGL